jgi:hypothetical protein
MRMRCQQSRPAAADIHGAGEVKYARRPECQIAAKINPTIRNAE